MQNTFNIERPCEICPDENFVKNQNSKSTSNYGKKQSIFVEFTILLHFLKWMVWIWLKYDEYLNLIAKKWNCSISVGDENVILKQIFDLLSKMENANVLISNEKNNKCKKVLIKKHSWNFNNTI